MIYLALTPLRGGGKRLIKKIINKYRLGNEYKEIKENIENKGGSSNGNEVWYRIKNYKEVDNYQSSEVDLIIDTLQNSDTLNVVGYYYDSNYANYIKGYAIPIRPKKFNNYDLYGFALFESKFDMNGQMFIIKGDFKDMIITSDPNHPILILMDKYCELSTKEEIEKYMNEQINQ